MNNKLIDYRAHSILLQVVSLKDGLSKNISIDQAKKIYLTGNSVVQYALENSNKNDLFINFESWWNENKVTLESMTFVEYLDNILEVELNNNIEKKYGTINDSICLLINAIIERFYHSNFINGNFETIY